MDTKRTKTEDKHFIDTIRVLSAETVDKANSGHPGLPLGAAPMAYVLWDKVMKTNPHNPKWHNRDRFVLSAGHGSALLYTLLHLYDYGLSIDELKNFRQMDSLTPGHPEYGWTVGVEATTGPLGQGLAMAVGMAMAEKHLAAQFNKTDFPIVDHYTYVIAGDGCMMEGITNEASSLAGTLKLDKLIVLYDSNDITIEGSTDLAFHENVRGRYEALGWDTFYVEDGEDIEAVLNAVEAAKASPKPAMIEIRTLIGYGSPKEGTCDVHGSPLGAEGTACLKQNLGWKVEEAFHVSEEVYAQGKARAATGEELEARWNALFAQYAQRYPEDAVRYDDYFTGVLPVDYLNSDDYYTFEKAYASRASSEVALNRIAEKLPQLFGGSADLASSNKSAMKGRASFLANTPEGSNIHFGVREHAMAAVSNGIALHGGLKAYCATFFVFSDYLKPALRLSALMELPVIYIFTHDSIGVGEDGPTHEPIEHMAMLRAMPGIVNFRPCDARETAAAWSYAVQSEDKPVTLALTRQTLPNLEGTGKEAFKGGYVLKDFGGEPEMIFMASGSEVSVAMDAAKTLSEEGINVRVVSMPSFELFDAQSAEYKESVLPNAIRKRVSVEAYTDFGWGKYVGLDGISIAINRFGASAPAEQLFEHFGFTAENIVARAKTLL